MRDAEEGARPHGPADEEVEVPDAGCGVCVATLRVDQAQVAIMDLPGDTPHCAWRALIYAQLRAKGTQPTPDLLKSLGTKAVSLRATVIGHLADKEALFSPLWRPFEGATVTTEDGDIPEDWKDYVVSLK
eukprot:10794706-Alexandrium_andersonii.AAC.1